MATEDDADVPESGAVFTFGKSRFADNAPNKFWIRNDRVLQVACGDEHTALLAESGRIFTFGSNDWGQLGLGHSKPATKPSCIKLLKKNKAKLIACGRSCCLVATESNKLYAFGANGEGQLGLAQQTSSFSIPQIVESLDGIQLKILAAGTDHSAALTDDGEVYIWGGGSEGQLGLGGDETSVPKPTKLNIEEKVVCISCGYYHTALVTASGKLYTFGEAEHGKLGHGEDISDTSIPQEVSGIDGDVTWVSCGGSHTSAVTRDGKLYTFGDGSHGQLGHGNIRLHSDTPQQVASLQKYKVKQVFCGENHTAAITERGDLFTFGNGRHGKLALGEENFANQFKPSKVNRFDEFFVDSVSCGGCHMLVIAKPKVANGDWSDDDENEEETVLLKPKSLLIDALRRSEDMDLSGSFSARNRRREKQDPMDTLNRTLPPLISSMPNKSLPPVTASVDSQELHSKNPLNKPYLGHSMGKKQDAKAADDSDKVTDKDESEEENSSLGSVTPESGGSQDESDTERKVIEQPRTREKKPTKKQLQPRPRVKKDVDKGIGSEQSNEDDDEENSEEKSDGESIDSQKSSSVQRRPSPAGRENSPSGGEDEKPRVKARKSKKNAVDKDDQNGNNNPIIKEQGKSRKPVPKKRVDSEESETESSESEKAQKPTVQPRKKQVQGSEQDDSKKKKVKIKDEENKQKNEDEKRKKKETKSKDEDDEKGNGKEDEAKKEAKVEEKKKSKLCIIF